MKGLRRWPRAWGGGAGGTGRGSSSGSRASAASLCTRPGLCPLGAAIPTWGAEAEQRRIMSSAGREPDGVQGAMSARRARAPWGRAVGRSQSEARQAWSRKGPGEGARAGLSRVRLRDGRKSVHCGWKERREGRKGLGGAGEWEQGDAQASGSGDCWTAGLDSEGRPGAAGRRDHWRPTPSWWAERGRGVKKGKAVRPRFLKVPRQNEQKRLCFEVEGAEIGSDLSCARGAPRTGQGPGGGERPRPRRSQLTGGLAWHWWRLEGEVGDGTT